MTVRMHVDDSEQDAEFSRLLDIAPAITEHERVLALQFAAGQAAVHVDTGSLRGSEEIDSDYATGRWVGTVSFGGPSPGFENDPVDYAVYEAARGGPHDFTLSYTRLTDMHRAAVRRHLRGR